MIFISKKYKSLRIVLDAKTFVVLDGRKILTGLEGKFKNGKTIEFENFEYKTEDPKIIEVLKSSPDYGLDFYALESDKKGMTKEPKLSETAMRKLNEKKSLAHEAADTNKDQD